VDGLKEEVFALVRLALDFGMIERGVSHPGGKPETDTDHSISLAWLACSLAARFYPQLDPGLVAMLAVAHDAEEIYAGDTYAVTATAQSRARKREWEEQALRWLQRDFTVLPWLPQVIARYERQEDPEARLVRAVDKLMPKIVLRLEGRPAQRLAAHGVTREDIIAYRAYEDDLLAGIAADFPEVLQLRADLNAQLSPDDLIPSAGTALPPSGDRLDRLLAIVRDIDAHIDASRSRPFLDQPLAGDWARVTKVCEESGEVWAALSMATGENPRKGTGSWEKVLEELGDVISAALCAIQHLTKDEARTLAVMTAALRKAHDRIPGGSPDGQV
jgi:putative hydrolase of HD superfamily